MARLIDTGVFIDWERAGRPVLKLSTRIGEPFAMASISASELLASVLRASPGTRPRHRQEFVTILLERVPVLPFDLDVARVHARFAADLLAAGRQIGANDLLIAATASAHGLDLVARNRREFERVPGLIVRQPDW